MGGEKEGIKRVEIIIKMDNRQLMILLRVIDGNALKQMFAILKAAVDKATIMFAKDYIEISALSTSKQVAYNFMINGGEVETYSFNRGNEVLAFSFETSKMYSATRRVGRKDGITIEMYSGDSKLSVKKSPDDKSAGRAAEAFVDIAPTEAVRFSSDEEYDDHPNIKIKTKEFSGVCSSANATKCPFVIFKSLQYGIIFQGLTAENNTALYELFSDTETAPKGYIDDIRSTLDRLSLNNSEIPEDSDSYISGDSLEIANVKVPLADIKALGKINNISSTTSMIKFYFAESAPVKIFSPFSNYGTCVIFVRNT